MVVRKEGESTSHIHKGDHAVKGNIVGHIAVLCPPFRGLQQFNPAWKRLGRYCHAWLLHDCKHLHSWKQSSFHVCTGLSKLLCQQYGILRRKVYASHHKS